VLTWTAIGALDARAREGRPTTINRGGRKAKPRRPSRRPPTQRGTGNRSRAAVRRSGGSKTCALFGSFLSAFCATMPPNRNPR